MIYSFCSELLLLFSQNDFQQAKASPALNAYLMPYSPKILRKRSHTMTNLLLFI